jgi:drug/metabolite transporter (DMT)-like permease
VNLLRIVFVFLWSSGYLVGSIGARSVPPFALSAWRFLIAAGLLGAIALATRAPWPRGRRAWRDLVVTGVLLQGVQFGGGYAAMALGVPAGLTAMVLCLSPTVVAVLSGPVLGEPLGRWGRWGSALAVTGALVAGADHLGTADATPAGLGLLLVGLAGFAGGTLYQKRVGASMDLRTGTAVQLLAGAAVVTPMAFLLEGGLPLPTTPTGIGALAWLGVVNSTAGAVLLFVLLRRGTGAAASGLLYLVPPVTAVLAVPTLGQPLSPWTVAGLTVTLAGVVLVNRPLQDRDRDDQAQADVRGGDHERLGPQRLGLEAGADVDAHHPLQQPDREHLHDDPEQAEDQRGEQPLGQLAGRGPDRGDHDERHAHHAGGGDHHGVGLPGADHLVELAGGGQVDGPEAQQHQHQADQGVEHDGAETTSDDAEESGLESQGAGHMILLERGPRRSP